MYSIDVILMMNIAAECFCVFLTLIALIKVVNITEILRE